MTTTPTDLTALVERLREYDKALRDSVYDGTQARREAMIYADDIREAAAALSELVSERAEQAATIARLTDDALTLNKRHADYERVLRAARKNHPMCGVVHRGRFELGMKEECDALLRLHLEATR